MSQYVFYCRACRKEFTQVQHMSERQRSPVICPHCGGKRVEQVMTAFSAVTSRKS